ncbi:MAG: transglutaminase family protein [Roseibium aggregatum]|jgi:hypothetical protein|uniref:transglutaminase-like domain-containing protein n=1 Tax=uncultured Roseibium sp. TaxID=1936171 RepID=UPI002633A758|nr:transglutaminase family protein [uncultured Roseibium sp.]
MPDAAPLLASSQLLDYRAPSIVRLTEDRSWRRLPQYDRIGAIYDFVRNEIAFGYNRADNIPASEVLRDGYGQCNTKGTLLMALLRGVGINCRLRGFMIHKELQRGVVPDLIFPIAPQEILHSWVEVEFDGKWINLEGFILDDKFLSVLQQNFSGTKSLCGFGAGTDCLDAPPVRWEGHDTYIQETGIEQDFGVFETPDQFYSEHMQKFGRVRGLLYRFIIRHWMNTRVRAIRSGRLKPSRSAIHDHGGIADAA